MSLIRTPSSSRKPLFGPDLGIRGRNGCAESMLKTLLVFNVRGKSPLSTYVKDGYESKV